MHACRRGNVSYGLCWQLVAGNNGGFNEMKCVVSNLGHRVRLSRCVLYFGSPQCAILTCVMVIEAMIQILILVITHCVPVYREHTRGTIMIKSSLTDTYFNGRSISAVFHANHFIRMSS